MNNNIILTSHDGIELTIFDEKYTYPQAEGWTVKLTPSEAALLAAKLLKFASEIYDDKEIT